MRALYLSAVIGALLCASSAWAVELAGGTAALEVGLRGYYVNDQRIGWSGLETTFGAEGFLRTYYQRRAARGTVKAEGEFFINQPFDKNRLSDGNRKEYLPNFDGELFEISLLNIGYEKGGFSASIGKERTPFGRAYFPVFSNSRSDAPVIRTEAILWRETGIFLKYSSGIFSLDAALTNGSEDRDTNSSKAGIARIGLGGERWAFGVSGKTQDGIGSENQKTYKNHYGVDFMVSRPPFILSGEAIYDEYGFRRDYGLDGDGDGIFWPHGQYYRDVFYKYKTPITGIGGYIDFGFQGSVWLLNLNYGEYYPKKIGHPYHDDPIRRGIFKAARRLAPGVSVYFMGLVENTREQEEWMEGDPPVAVLLGFQYLIGGRSRSAGPGPSKGLDLALWH